MELTRYGHADARDVRAMLLDIHDEAYVDDPNEFHSRERFAGFVDRWSSKKTWSCVIGFDEGEPVGYAYGALFSHGAWWRGVATPDWLTENRRVFALSELMIVPKWRRTGASVQVHDALVNGQDAYAITLFVESAHPRVQALYEGWGYRKIDECKPFEDSPLYSVMAMELSGSGSNRRPGSGGD